MSKADNEDPICAKIREVHELLNPEPIKRGHIPAWVKTAIQTAIKENKLPKSDKQSARRLLNLALQSLGDRWVDHLGSIKRRFDDGLKEVLVSETVEL